MAHNGDDCWLCGRWIEGVKIHLPELCEEFTTLPGGIKRLHSVDAVVFEVIGESVKNQMVHLSAPKNFRILGNLGDSPAGKVGGCVVLMPYRSLT